MEGQTGMNGANGAGEEIVYDAYLEVYDDGSCLAQLLDLIGCYARDRSEAAALAALTERIPAYYAWLSRHDEYTPVVYGPFRVAPVVRMRVSGHTGAFFSPAAEPVSDEDLDWALALLDWAYADVNTAIETTRARSGGGGVQALALADTTAQTQLWLLSRLEPRPATVRIGQLAGTPLDRLHQVGQASLARLRSASEEERQQLLNHEGEWWTLRKVLWRSILAVREATDALELLESPE
jgi:hypothetical protein